MTDEMDLKPEPAITLTFPELKSDILELMSQMFSTQAESYVTKAELELLRQQRDKQAQEGNTRLDSVDTRLDGFETKLNELSDVLGDIKKHLTSLSTQDRQYRQKQFQYLQKIESGQQEYQRKADEKIIEIRDMVTSTDNRVTQSLEVANTAVERANASMGGVVELRSMVENKLDPIRDFIFGDENRPSLMEHLKLQNSQTTLEINNSHNQLMMQIDANKKEMATFRNEVTAPLEAVKRFNTWADRIVAFLKSKSGIALMTSIVTVYFSNSPIGEFLVTLVKILTQNQ